MNENEIEYVGTSQPTNEIELIAPKFEAVIACGMGPVTLKESRDPHNHPVPDNVFSFFNAVATKIMVSRGWANEAILSGYRSRKTPREGISQSLSLEEIAYSEGKLLSHIYEQAHLKDIDQITMNNALAHEIIDEKATTTFGNIFEGLNILDSRDLHGRFEGSFGIISSEFHGPRIAEMLVAFGLKNGRFVSAEGSLQAAGYRGGERGYGKSYKARNAHTYPGQPAGLQNLMDNPSYVTRDLAVIHSDRRFHDVANALKRYYRERADPVELPDCYNLIPDTYDPRYDYASAKEAFAKIAFTKHDYIGDINTAIARYKSKATELTKETETHLLQNV